MDRSRVIYLISGKREQDDEGVWRKSEETRRKVFAQINSVTGSEFFEGGRNGLNPELRFTLFAYDYKGEEIVEYNGHLYGVYRTYFQRTDIIELYTEKKGGVN